MLATQSHALLELTQDQLLPLALLVLLAPTAHTRLTDHGLNNQVFAHQVCTHRRARTCARNVPLVASVSTRQLRPSRRVLQLK